MTDLFGLEQQTPRKNDRREAAALVEVLKALNTHAAVAWCERMNSGAARMGSRFVRFGFKGCPDVLGQLKDGRLLGVEVKAKTGRLRPEQAYSWSVCVVLVAWHSWPVTCATCCASWGRHDLPDLHSPLGRDAVGLLAGYRLPHRAGYPLPVRETPRPAEWPDSSSASLTATKAV